MKQYGQGGGGGGVGEEARRRIRQRSAELFLFIPVCAALCDAVCLSPPYCRMTRQDQQGKREREPERLREKASDRDDGEQGKEGKHGEKKWKWEEERIKERDRGKVGRSLRKGEKEIHIKESEKKRVLQEEWFRVGDLKRMRKRRNETELE